jgi:hypothetical protein
MTDIFREVDEDLRREQAKRLWDRFAPYVIALAVLIVAVTAGYRGWVYWQERQAAASGDRFLAALDLATAGKHAEAITALEALTKDGSGNYPVLASFRIAAEKAGTGDVKGAVETFDAIAVNTTASPDIRTMARLRAGMLLVDTMPFPEFEKRIGDLASTGNVWRHSARELLGLAAWRTGDYDAARKYFDMINSDQDSPQDLRQRAQLMLSLITARLGAPPAKAPG